MNEERASMYVLRVGEENSIVSYACNDNLCELRRLLAVDESLAISCNPNTE